MKKIRGLALGLAAGVLLSGCGAGGGDSGPSPFAPEERDRLLAERFGLPPLGPDWRPRW